MSKYRKWLICQDWNEVYKAETPSEKAHTLQTMLFQNFLKLFPEKTLRISSDDQPWITHKQKILDRQRKREYNKHRKSDKWVKLDKLFKTSVKCAKK